MGSCIGKPLTQQEEVKQLSGCADQPMISPELPNQTTTTKSRSERSVKEKIPQPTAGAVNGVTPNPNSPPESTNASAAGNLGGGTVGSGGDTASSSPVRGRAVSSADSSLGSLLPAGAFGNRVRAVSAAGNQSGNIKRITSVLPDVHGMLFKKVNDGRDDKNNEIAIVAEQHAGPKVRERGNARQAGERDVQVGTRSISMNTSEAYAHEWRI